MDELDYAFCFQVKILQWFIKSNRAKQSVASIEFMVGEGTEFWGVRSMSY